MESRALKVAPTEITSRQAVVRTQQLFLELGFLFREQPVSDYGIDAHVERVEDPRPTGQLLALQIKGGESFVRERTRVGYVFRSDDAHMHYWLRHSLPVVVTIHDPQDDKVYWQAITEDTAKSTGICWKVEIPARQTVDESSLEKLSQLATNVVPAHRYSILKQGDISWAGAKRYSLDILINGTLTKAEIAQVIRQVVIEHIGSRYYRDPIVESHWGDADAHVIFVFVYLTLEDRRDANWICRSLWIDEDLPEEDAPIRIEGENIGASIITDWSKRYASLASVYREFSVRKEDYLSTVQKLLEDLCPLMDLIVEALEREKRTPTSSADSVLRASQPEISRLYDSGNDLGLAPVECRDVDTKLQNILLDAHNLVLPFVDFVTDRTRNTYLESRTVTDYREQLAQLHYELSKIR